MRTSTLIVLCGIAMVFYGCSLQYSGPVLYNEVQYDSSEKALEAQHEDWNHILSTIIPAKTMLPYRAIIVLPTQSAIEAKWIRSTGSPPEKTRYLKVFNYAVQLDTADLDNIAEAIKKRRLFQEVSITKSSNPDKYRTPDDVLTIYPTIGKKKFRDDQWFVRIPSKDDAIPIYYDVTLPPGRARLVSLLDYLERKVVQELGR